MLILTLSDFAAHWNEQQSMKCTKQVQNSFRPLFTSSAHQLHASLTEPPSSRYEPYLLYSVLSPQAPEKQGQSSQAGSRQRRNTIKCIMAEKKSLKTFFRNIIFAQSSI